MDPVTTPTPHLTVAGPLSPTMEGALNGIAALIPANATHFAIEVIRNRRLALEAGRSVWQVEWQAWAHLPQRD